MRDEEKIIQVNTLKDFGRELGRDGDETPDGIGWRWSLLDI